MVPKWYDDDGGRLPSSPTTGDATGYPRRKCRLKIYLLLVYFKIVFLRRQVLQNVLNVLQNVLMILVFSYITRYVCVCTKGID